MLLLLLTTLLALADPSDTKPLVRASTAPQTAPAARWALLIGVDDYDDEAIADLKFPSSDAAAVASALIESGAWPAEQVVLMTPDRADPLLRPTRTNVLRQLARLASAQGTDTLLVYFSGHGAAEGNPGEARNYLFPQDTSLEIPAQSGIAVDELMRAVDGSTAARRFVVFDACRNRLAVATKAFPPAWQEPRYTLSSGTGVLYCTQFGEYSYEDAQAGFGACTDPLVAGLRGAADGADGTLADGVVSTREIYPYVYNRLSAASTTGSRQLPTSAGETVGAGFALVPVPEWATPPKEGPVTRAELSAQIDLAIANCAHGQDLLRGYAEVSARLPALSEPLTDELAVRWHRLDALHALRVLNVQGAAASLAAVSDLIPGQNPRVGIPDACWRDALAQAPTNAAKTLVEEDIPRGVRLLVDGRSADTRPGDRVALVQAVDDQGKVLWTQALSPNQALPPINITDVIKRRNRAVAGLGWSAGGVAVASAGLLVGALLTEQALKHEAVGATEGDLPALRELRDRSDTLGYAAQAGVGLAVGLGVAALVVRF